MAASLIGTTEKNFIKLARTAPNFLKELKKVDPRDRYVVLFPDSKNFRAGMGFELLRSAAAERAYIEANRFLDWDLFKLCLEGPQADLKSSLIKRNLAAFVTSHAAMQKLAEKEPDTIKFTASSGGLGVGFINTLVFCESISFIDGLDLVLRYSQAMEEAARIVPSKKVALKLWPATSKFKLCIAAKEYCIKKGVPPEIAVCSVIEYLKPQVIVVGGHQVAIDFIKNEGQRLFDYRILDSLEPYEQSAFHTDLMRPAADFMSEYIKHKLDEKPDFIRDPVSCSLFSPVSGYRLRITKSICKDLYEYPTSAIKTEQLLHSLFMRDKKLHQPNILVLWDKSLLTTLKLLNRKAWSSAKLVGV